MVEDRGIYRCWVKCEDLVSFSIKEGETDLLVMACSDLEREALDAARTCRGQIEEYISHHPEFKTSLEPCDVGDAPPIVKEMVQAAGAAGVGPMAAVAGAVAEFVGHELKKNSNEVMVENGGDIYADAERDLTVGLFAGSSPFTGKLAISVKGVDTPLGICTSSGTVGHSLSFGRADAVTILCRSTALADAHATAFANLVKEPDDIDRMLEMAGNTPNILGILVVLGEKLGSWGKIELA